MTTVNITLSQDQTEGTKATIASWVCKVGDYVEKNQPIVELETDKVMMEVIAPASGKLQEIILQEGQEIPENTVLGIIDTSAQTTKVKQNLHSKINEPQALIETFFTDNDSNDHNSQMALSPAVRRLLQKHKLELSAIKGTGRNGRVTSRDIGAFLQQPVKNKVSAAHTLKSEKIAHTSMRKNIAQHMVQSLLHTAPHVTSVFNLDLSAIIAHRKEHKQNFMDKGANLTFTAYFIAASVAAIKQQPLINAQWHDEFIETFASINIGVGTALADKGLIVPVIKDCHNKDLFAIAKELTRLTNKARAGELKPRDVKEGTFTISNHGVSGSLVATPIIINQPQSAILGIGAMEKRVVVKTINEQDVMMIKPMCYVSLTIDHRVLDAYQCNQFLSVFVETLENFHVPNTKTK